MADPKSPDKTATPRKPGPGNTPESPTTARELDFDDEPQETGVISTEGPTGAAKAGTGEEAAPPKPPRPLSPQQQAENTLKEAFPSVDATVVKAVLMASGGQVEPAFNALLAMTDPDAVKETPPPQPPRPTQTSQSQLEADEMYARQLAEHYNSSTGQGERRSSGRGRNPPGRGQSGQRTDLYGDDRERSFIDDDLPVIRDNIKKGFLETQSKVNRWVADFKKRLDGEDPQDYANRPQGYSSGPPQQSYGYRRSGETGRRSGDRSHYDADPQLLPDDFTGLELRDNENTSPPPRSTRPLANPDLFKPSYPPRPDTKNTTAIPSGPIDEVENAEMRTPGGRKGPDRGPSPNNTGKSSKWQPLSSLAPKPVEENDPFTLGDSDDEREAKSKDIKAEDTARLKKAAEEAMSEEIGSPERRKLEPHQKTGSVGQQDKEAVEKLTGGDES